MNVKNISKYLFVLSIILVIVSVSGCEKIQPIIDPTTSQIDDSDEKIVIGLVLPLTGRLSTQFGEPILQGLRLAQDEINDSMLAGTYLKFIVEDERSTVEDAVASYTKLIQSGVSVILGPATSTATTMAFPIADEHQIVAISPTSAARGLSAISDYTFRVALTTDVLVPNGVEVTHAKFSYQKVATLYDETDVFSTDSDVAIRESLSEIGVEILTTETFQEGETDFTAHLTRIKALDPDAIFVSSLPPEKVAILLKGHELGISVPFIMRTLTDEHIKAAGEAAEGAITVVGWGSAVDTPKNQEFIANYKERYGKEPNNYAARSYASLYILAEALANAESKDAMGIRDALANIRNYDTILGEFSFNEDGDAVYDPKILIVKDGKLELFE